LEKNHHSKVVRQTVGERSGFEAIACSNRHTTWGRWMHAITSSQQIHHAYLACTLASVTRVTLPIHPLFLGIKMDRYDTAAPGVIGSLLYVEYCVQQLLPD